MKEHEKNFDDFVCLLTLLGIATAFSEKENTDKSQSETKTAEKKCECTGNNCKNHKAFCEELLEKVNESEKKLTVEEFLENLQNLFTCCTKCEIRKESSGYTEIVCGGWLK